MHTVESTEHRYRVIAPQSAVTPNDFLGHAHDPVRHARIAAVDKLTTLPVFVSCGRTCLIRIVIRTRTEWFFVTVILFAGEKGSAAHVLSKIGFEGEFQTTNACVTVSLLSAEVIYGDSSTALFRRGGGRRELFPCSCEGARGSAFAQPADSKAGSRNRPTVV